MATRSAVRAVLGIILVMVVEACSAAAAPAAAPTAAPVTSVVAAEPSPTPVESVAPTETAAPTDSSAPTPSHKPLPSIDQAELDAFLTSSITLLDLADDDLAVTVAYVDPSSDESIDLGTYTLASTEQITNQVPAGTYRLEFHQPAGSSTPQTCTIEISDTDAVTFAAVQGAVAISKTGTAPKAAAELFVSTSSLCGN